MASCVDSDKVTVDSVKFNVINRVTADAMLANAGKGDLFSDGGMSQDENLIGNHSEGSSEAKSSLLERCATCSAPYIGMYRKWLLSSIKVYTSILFTEKPPVS